MSSRTASLSLGFPPSPLPGQALTSRLTPSSLARRLPDSASKNSLRGWGDSKQTNKQNTGRLWFPLLVFHLPGARTPLWCRNITMHHTELKWWSVLGVARQPPGSRPLRWSQQEQEHCPQHQPCWRPFRAAAIPGCCVTGKENEARRWCWSSSFSTQGTLISLA